MARIAFFWERTGEIKENSLNTVFPYMPFEILGAALYKTKIWNLLSLCGFASLNDNICALFESDKVNLGMRFRIFGCKFSFAATDFKIYRVIIFEPLFKIDIILVLYCGFKISILAVAYIQIL